MNDELLTFSHAVERDVDLLLVEELRCSRTFITWIAEKAEISGPLLSARVTHSRRRMLSRREIDILLEIDVGDAKRWLLIENKLDTIEQPGQAESYREECAALAASSSGAVARSILVCPEAYRRQQLAFALKFDFVVTYEQVIQHFERRMARETGELAERLRHRRDLMQQAVLKARRGYDRLPLASIGSFNELYVALLQGKYSGIIPGPQMMDTGGNPSESVSMIFDHNATLGPLPAGVQIRRLAHELGKGENHRSHYVAVTFAGWGRFLDRIEATGALTDTAYRLRSAASTARPNGGLVMYAETPPVTNDPARFEEQRQAIEAGLDALADLRRWVQTNHAVLASWAAVCAAQA